MSLASVTTIGGTVPPATAGRWEVTSPVRFPPLRFFRRTLILRFATGGITDGIRIESDATTLKGTFSSFDYDALNPGESALKALLSSSGGAVIVVLDAPRQVRQVRLSAGKASGSGYSVELYRLDGNTLAEKPTSSTGVQNNTAVFPESAGFTDARFAVRLKGPDAPSLSPGDLAALQVRSQFAGARIGLSVPDEPDSATFFWPTPDEIGETALASQTNVEAGKALAAALERYLEDFFARLETVGSGVPEFMDVALVVESDAPCVLDLGSLSVSYHLVSESFYSGEDKTKEKQVLRFPGDLGVTRELLLRLPSNATIKSASLETVESFSTDRPLGFGNGSSLPDEALARSEGVRVGVERWAAQGIVPQQAMTISGVAVALLAMTRNTRLLIELQEDWEGRPSGKKLAEAEITLDVAGRREWVALLFPEAVSLFTERYWLLVGTASGEAVWLADTGDGDVKVLDRTADAPVESKELSGLKTMYALLARDRQTREQQPASLGVGEHTVAGTAGQENVRTYDLASAIASYLDGSVAAAPETSISLTLTSALRGIVTVYPPEVAYDLP
jgi:hypothetical protein